MTDINKDYWKYANLVPESVTEVKTIRLGNHDVRLIVDKRVPINEILFIDNKKGIIHKIIFTPGFWKGKE